MVLVSDVSSQHLCSRKSNKDAADVSMEKHHLFFRVAFLLSLSRSRLPRPRPKDSSLPPPYEGGRERAFRRKKQPQHSLLSNNCVTQKQINEINDLCCSFIDMEE